MQRTFRWLFAAYVLFTIYNTLIPFDFVLSLEFARLALQRVSAIPFMAQEGGRVSLTDIGGNVILFIPFGFLGFGALRRKLGRGTLIVALSVAGALLSLSIEILQLFLIERNTAVHDLICNATGAFMGAVAGAVYLGSLSRKLAELVKIGLKEQPVAVLAALMLAIQAVAAAMPMNVAISVSDFKRSLKTINIMPFGSRALIPGNERFEFSWIDFSEDLIFLALLGLVLGFCARNYARNNRTYRTLLLGIIPLALFPALELGQLFIRSRITDINDILVGWLGTWAGIALASYLGRDEPMPRRLPGRAEIQAGLVLFTSFVILTNLKPFDFTTDFTLLNLKVGAINFIPFYLYFKVTKLWNIYDLAGTIGYGVPFGFLWVLSKRESGVNRGVVLGAVLIPLILGAVLELAQYFSPTRSMDLTDVISFGIGGYLGYKLYVRYGVQLLGRGSHPDGAGGHAAPLGEPSPHGAVG